MLVYQRVLRMCLHVPSGNAAAVDAKVARPDSEVALPGDASPAPGHGTGTR